MVCRKKAGAVDLNTKSLQNVATLMRRRKLLEEGAIISKEDSFKAKKEAISHVFGHEVSRELLEVDCGVGDVDGVEQAAMKSMLKGDFDMNSLENNDPGSVFAYTCTGLITNATYCVKNSSAAFVIFINDRLVECGGIKRAVEAVYQHLLPRVVDHSFIYPFKSRGLTLTSTFLQRRKRSSSFTRTNFVAP